MTSEAIRQCLRALEIRQAVGSASVKKVYALRGQMTAANRVHDLFTVDGARTGRPTGSGPQPTNFPNSGPEVRKCAACGRWHPAARVTCPWCFAVRGPDSKAEEWNADAAEDGLLAIATRDLDFVEAIWIDALAVMGGCLRSLLCTDEEHEFICSDYSAIEAVVNAMLAGEQWRIDVFRTHGKIYEASAAATFKVPLEEILAHKTETGHHHPLRKKGKVTELALGFLGWIGALRAMGFEDSDDEARELILKWRAASPNIVFLGGGQSCPASTQQWHLTALAAGGATNAGPEWEVSRARAEGVPPWKGVPYLHGLEGMAVLAIQNPGVQYPVMRLDGTFSGLTMYVHADVLYMFLPDGSYIPYHRPRLAPGKDDWRGLQISYEGYNTNPKMGAYGWCVMTTYSGKLLENCVAGGTLVLTGSGWKRIDCISLLDSVHDGIEFVRHEGTLFKSWQTCVTVDGVAMTPDHKVLSDAGTWQAASQLQRPYRPAIREAHGAVPGREGRKNLALVLLMRLRRLLRKSSPRREQRHSGGARTELRLPDQTNAIRGSTVTWYEQAPCLPRVAVDERSLPIAFAPSLGELRRSRHHSVRALADELREFLGRHGRLVRSRLGLGPTRQRAGLLARELPLGFETGELKQYASEPSNRDPSRTYDDQPGGRDLWAWPDDDCISSSERLAAGTSVRLAKPDKPRPVYDIVNCGPRHRFVVLGDSGPMIVHNCCQATANRILRHGQHRLEAAGYPVVLHVYDENAAEVPRGFGSIEQFEAEMNVMPPWAAGWPIKAKGGWRGRRYRK